MSFAHRIRACIEQHRAAFYTAGLLAAVIDLYALARFGVI